MTLTIKGDKKLEADLSKYVTQLPYAMMLTLNDLAFDMQKSLNADIKAHLKTRVNTSKAYAVDKASKTSLEATVRMKRDWHYLSLVHHYTGGEAAPIGFERWLIGKGYMSSSQSAIPIKKMGKAAYAKTKAAVSSRGSNMFVATKTNRHTAHLHPGIYKRLKRKVKPIILFTSEAEYSKRLDMMTIAKKVMSRRAEQYFKKNMDRAIGSAR